MKSARYFVALLLVISLFCAFSEAQQSATASSAIVPRLVNFSGRTTDAAGKNLTGTVGVVFALYRDQFEGAPLWLESQNVQADAKGNYSVQLGATKPDGLPIDVFGSGEARWLGVRVNGGEEQPRVLLLSVPYALKALDAETIHGLPPSAFVLAAPSVSGLTPQSQVTSSSVPPPASSNVTTTGGSVGSLSLFTTATNVQSSIATQTGSGASGRIGINTSAPAATLDVNGGLVVRGNLTSPAMGTATASRGFNSQPQDFIASAFNSSTPAAVAQRFQWQAEPLNNDKSTASGTLNLLYASGSATPAETGLKINNKGQLTFAAGQTFPGTGSGTVKSVGLSAPTSDFTVSGSPVTGTGTLGFAWKTSPTSTNKANAIVKRDASGNFDAGNVNVIALNANSNGTGGVAIIANSTVSAGVLGGSSSNSGVAGTSVSGAGVFGDSNSGAGVLAQSSSGVGVSASSSSNVGVQGSSGNQSTGIGILGQVFGSSDIGVTNVGPRTIGVWGDTGHTGSAGIGVAGSSDDGSGVVGVNASQAVPAGYFENDEAGEASNVFEATSATNGGFCVIDVFGNLSCTGVKSAVVPIAGRSNRVALYAIEGPENWFEDLGGSQLSNGGATVRLEPTFAQTVNTEVEYRVFLTPNGDCRGLYVTNKSATSFEVHELGGGTSSISFDYRIIAKRRGFEKLRLAEQREPYHLKGLPLKGISALSVKEPKAK